MCVGETGRGDVHAAERGGGRRATHAEAGLQVRELAQQSEERVTVADRGTS